MGTSSVTSTHSWIQAVGICDMVAIDDTFCMLAVRRGLLKAAYDQLIKHYHEGESVSSLCHLADSMYLVGFTYDGLVVWDEKKDEQLFRISEDEAFSIKRVLLTTSSCYMIKTGGGVMVLTIEDLNS